MSLLLSWLVNAHFFNKVYMKFTQFVHILVRIMCPFSKLVMNRLIFVLQVKLSETDGDIFATRSANELLCILKGEFIELDDLVP